MKSPPHPLWTEAGGERFLAGYAGRILWPDHSDDGIIGGILAGRTPQESSSTRMVRPYLPRMPG